MVYTQEKKEMNLLPVVHFESARTLIECGSLSGLPKAKFGKTTVYLPKRFPFVIKELGEERAKRRYLANMCATELCTKYCIEHLIVPKCSILNAFTVEERFPVLDVTLRSQTALYLKDPHQFIKVAQEFTLFLLKTHFPDILTLTHPYQCEYSIPLGRFDNLPLYVEGGIGKIALIDLGGHRVRKNPATYSEIIECVNTAIALFPYHLKEICRVADVSCEPFQERTERTKSIFQNIVIGETVTKREVQERRIEESTLYHNFYVNRRGQLMVVIHQ